MEQIITYKTACSEAEFIQARILFREYADELGVDLSFQDFEKELETIHILYNKPDGRLLLVSLNDRPIGCAGIRRLDEKTAELKRMYIKSECRGHRAGVELLIRSLAAAKELGYIKMRLDTLENMTRAQELYRSYGFYIIPSYRFNPLKGTIYMEKLL
jgi:putative acetyltransferase